MAKPQRNSLDECSTLPTEANGHTRRPRKESSALLEDLQKSSDLLTNEEAACYIGVTPGTLEVWRCTKRYEIPYIKVGRLVRYRPAALDKFLTARTVTF